MLTLLRVMAMPLVGAGGIAILLGVLAGLFRAAGGGADSAEFVIGSILWGVLSIWIALRVLRAPAPSGGAGLVMVLLYAPLVMLAVQWLG